MQFNPKKTWAWLSLLVLTAVISLVWHQSLPRTSTLAECTIYRAFYNFIPEKDAAFLRPLTSTQNISYYVDEGPHTFSRFTGETEEISLIPDGEKITVTKTEPFEMDTSEFFHPIVNRKPAKLKPCFTQQEGSPKFHAGNLLSAKQSFVALSNDAAYPTLWTLSSVGISEDDSYALLFASHYCGPLCAGGSFYLLKKVSGEWVVIAVRMAWVS